MWGMGVVVDTASPPSTTTAKLTVVGCWWQVFVDAFHTNSHTEDRLAVQTTRVMTPLTPAHPSPR